MGEWKEEKKLMKETELSLMLVNSDKAQVKGRYTDKYIPGVEP